MPKDFSTTTRSSYKGITIDKPSDILQKEKNGKPLPLLVRSTTQLRESSLEIKHNVSFMFNQSCQRYRYGVFWLR